MSATITIFGSAVLAVLLAGYFAQRFLPPPKPTIVGIDLGTTFSCVGVYQAGHGSVDVLKNTEGKKCIPSIVSFNLSGVYVGYAAQRNANTNAANTIYDAKRFLGKQFTEESLAKEKLRYGFKMTLDNDGNVRYVIAHGSNTSLIAPEEISAAVLRELRFTAERNLHATVTRAVISVPAEFDAAQRNATKAAAKLAGLNVLRVVNEPTAAALAYGLDRHSGLRHVMVVDLGGGTLDVSLLRAQEGMFLTQAMAGNNYLGGQDFNQRLSSYVLSEFNSQGQSLKDSDVNHLHNVVEQAKLDLTRDEQTVLEFKGSEGRTFRKEVTRRHFESLNADLFDKVLEPVQRVLEAVEMQPHEIDDVVLVGGSTRIPRVREIIAQYFGKDANTSIDPELAVVIGVSVQAGVLGGAWPLTVSAVEVPTHVRKIILT